MIDIFSNSVLCCKKILLLDPKVLRRKQLVGGLRFCYMQHCRILLTLTHCIKYVILLVMSILLIADCRVFHLGKEELGIVLNSGAVLQRLALFHLKMHPG